MDTNSQRARADEVAEKLFDTFQGWHVSNQRAAGRTLFAWARRTSAVAVAIEERIKSEGAKKARGNNADPEVKAMLGTTGNVKPLTVRIRGGSAYCATTSCDVVGYYVLTETYNQAKALVRQAIASVVREAKYNYTRPPPGSLAAARSDWDDAVFGDGRLKDYHAAIDLATKIRHSAEAGWRDPRSREATAIQFDAAINALAFGTG